ncbi:MAG: hypothetical protein E7580_02150 [Ruminococcaceae bacterium]|nr:hypothetical protein [Oscillospiraceae bacterium]
MKDIKLIAMDLDGTLTQHKTPLSALQRQVLTALSQKYKLLMVGAGQVMRIFNQLEQFPIDIIGNYGLQCGTYNHRTGEMEMIRDEVLPCDRESVSARIAMLREKYGFTEFAGESVEFHPSGCVTFPILGTKAKQEDKLAFDPDRSKRRKIYDDVVNTFSDYCVFVGGSSSFDMAPKPRDKYYALDVYCKEHGYKHSEVVYIGDDYGLGGNDESVYKSDFNYLTIDNYLDFPKVVAELLAEVDVDYWTQSPKNVFVAAHRGWRSKYPENTMEAFRAALDLGVDQIETDVRVTRDGKLVLIHDATVDRTTNGTGNVEDYTLEELQKLDAGNGTKIPTLIDLMELVKDYPTLTLDLELKEYPTEGRVELSHKVCDEIIKIVEEYGFGDRVVINSFHGDLLEYVVDTYGPKYRLHTFYPPRYVRQPTRDIYPDAYCACVFGITKGEVSIEEAKEFGKKYDVRLWAGSYAKDEESIDLAVAMGAELITCDNPDEVLAILRKKGLHR